MKYQRGPGVRARVLNGQRFIAREGNVFELNETAAIVWKMLQQPVEVGTIAAEIAKEYAVEPQVVEADTTNLLQELVDLGFAVAAAE